MKFGSLPVWFQLVSMLELGLVLLFGGFLVWGFAQDLEPAARLRALALFLVLPLCIVAGFAAVSARLIRAGQTGLATLLIIAPVLLLPLGMM